MRIDKYLAHLNIGSRKDIKKLLRKGLIYVNDIVIKDASCRLHEGDSITYLDHTYIYKEYVYYMLNKPKDYICATKDNKHLLVTDLFDRNDIFPVGRLDIDTTGLLLMTNDGVFAHNLTSPKHNINKVYLTLVNGKVDENDILSFKQGIVYKDSHYLPAKLKVLEIKDNLSLCKVTITEGKYHQVKRMFKSINKPVIQLKRIQIGTLQLDNTLKEGQYRELTLEEINNI